MEFVKQADEDSKEIKEDLERTFQRMKKIDLRKEAEWNSKKGTKEQSQDKLSVTAHILLGELGLRPMPSNQVARERIPGQVTIHGCPEDPCIGKQHCSICGLHGKRDGDGHEHEYKRVE